MERPPAKAVTEEPPVPRWQRMSFTWSSGLFSSSAARAETYWQESP